MNLTATRKWIFGGIAVAVLVALVGWFFVVSPARSAADETWLEVELQRQANDQATARLAQLEKQSTEVPAKLAEVESVKRKMPAEPRQADLVRSVEQQAATAGVELTGITPATPVTLADASTGTVVLPMALTAKGTYTGIKTFVDNLERQQRAFLIVDLEVATDEAGREFTVTLNGNFFSLPAGALDNPSASTGTDNTQPQAQASAKLPVQKGTGKH